MHIWANNPIIDVTQPSSSAQYAVASKYGFLSLPNLLIPTISLYSHISLALCRPRSISAPLFAGPSHAVTLDAPFEYSLACPHDPATYIPILQLIGHYRIAFFRWFAGPPLQPLGRLRVPHSGCHKMFHASITTYSTDLTPLL
jgi:hypothetical protein